MKTYSIPTIVSADVVVATKTGQGTLGELRNQKVIGAASVGFYL